jgi:hypothetical protein
MRAFLFALTIAVLAGPAAARSKGPALDFLALKTGD